MAAELETSPILINGPETHYRNTTRCRLIGSGLRRMGAVLVAMAGLYLGATILEANLQAQAQFPNPISHSQGAESRRILATSPFVYTDEETWQKIEQAGKDWNTYFIIYRKHEEKLNQLYDERLNLQDLNPNPGKLSLALGLVGLGLYRRGRRFFYLYSKGN